MSDIWLKLIIGGRASTQKYEDINDARIAAMNYIKDNNLEGWSRGGQDRWVHHDGTVVVITK